MKRMILSVLLGLFVLSCVCAAAGTTELKNITGFIIDNQCASQHKKDLDVFVKTHTKECALKPESIASGYSFYSEGKLVAFDDASNNNIVAFLKNPHNTLEVMVNVQANDKWILTLESIKNQAQ